MSGEQNVPQDRVVADLVYDDAKPNDGKHVNHVDDDGAWLYEAHWVAAGESVEFFGAKPMMKPTPMVMKTQPTWSRKRIFSLKKSAAMITFATTPMDPIDTMTIPGVCRSPCASRLPASAFMIIRVPSTQSGW